MLYIKAQELIDQAREGKILTAKERRHCIDYILSIGSGNDPDDANKKGKHATPLTIQEMAELFGVSTRQITLDKRIVREQRAKEVGEEDISLVLADIDYTFSSEIAALQRAKKKAKAGSSTYLQYVKAITELTSQRIKLLQDLGYYPKNIGNLTVAEYDFTAQIDSMTGKVNSVKSSETKVIDTTAAVIEETVLKAG